jgi:streptomycin 6-kinase
VRDTSIDVPAIVRGKAALLGPAGERWLADLPDIVGALEQRWSITVVEPLTGGSASFVARVCTDDGVDAVLKVALPDENFDSQARTMVAARGHGYAHLLAHDPDRDAVLLESLGPSLHELRLPPEQAIDVLCAVLREAWRVPRGAAPAVTPETERAAGLGRLVERLWTELDTPCPERVVAKALRFAEHRAAAFDVDRCVVVHGDPHPGNALRVTTPRVGAESGFVFVDPDGVLTDPAYDLGVVLRDWSPQLLAGDARSLARRYCRLLADRTGIDATAIWEWGFLERVSTGLYILECGAEDLARPFLATAELLA